MRPFFSSWQLWEKMTFVMAMAIVVVIVIASGVRLYNSWRLRKYEALQQVSVQHRQALAQNPDVATHDKAEIPFGIRAIQSGVQVDGVWISGSNTPTQSAQNSRAPSIMLDTDPSHKSISPESAEAGPSNLRLDMPPPAHRHSTQGRPSTASRSSALPNNQPLQMDRLPNRLSADYVPRGRPSYQPRRSSGLRYSNIEENSDALDALEGRRKGTLAEAGVSQGMQQHFISRIRRELPGPQRPESYELVLMPPKPGYLSTEHSSGSSNASSSGEEHQHVPRRPPMVRGPSRVLYDSAYPSRNIQREFDADQRSSFDALAHHRRSQGAEEGHLYPRTRLNQASDSIASTPAEHGYVIEESYSAEEANDPFVTPLGTPLGSPMSHLEEPPSFASFVNSNPPPNGRTASPNHSEGNSPAFDDDVIPSQHSDDNRKPRHPQVVRELNSGFEILHPSSFSQPQKTYSGDWNRDLENGSGEDYPSARLNRGPKKLQRKRADSKESRFKEQV